MPSESERWKTGDLRNTIGQTEGPTGAVAGGVDGQVTAQDIDKGRPEPGVKRPPAQTTARAPSGG